jgi:hypothetical protein
VISGVTAFNTPTSVLKPESTDSRGRALDLYKDFAGQAVNVRVARVFCTDLVQQFNVMIDNSLDQIGK